MDPSFKMIEGVSFLRMQFKEVYCIFFDETEDLKIAKNYEFFGKTFQAFLWA
jgi:hypothetical protein